MFKIVVSLLFCNLFSCFAPTLARQTPFLEPGFFFDWNIQSQPVPIPVTEQCASIHISWGRSTATGPTATAPYTMQVYTSTSITPFIIDAGDGTSYDWDVPFAPGTQYQVCMFDKNGVTGGCQAIYTVIANSTVPHPTCQNVTAPASTLEVKGEVNTGPLSQYGFIDQCSDLSIQPQSGRPPYTLTIAPSLHPVYNITSNNMNPINWTVSLSWASPFFISLSDSDGLTWSNGPMHVGRGTDNCMYDDTAIVRHTREAVVGSVIGGMALGCVLAVIAIFLFGRRRSRMHSSDSTSIQEKGGDLDMALPSLPMRPPTIDTPQDASSSEELTRPLSERALSVNQSPSRTLGSATSRTFTTVQTGQSTTREVFVRHQDAGRVAVPALTSPTATEADLPPMYSGLIVARPGPQP